MSTLTLPTLTIPTRLLIGSSMVLLAACTLREPSQQSFADETPQPTAEQAEEGEDQAAPQGAVAQTRTESSLDAASPKKDSAEKNNATGARHREMAAVDADPVTDEEIDYFDESDDFGIGDLSAEMELVPAGPARASETASGRLTASKRKAEDRTRMDVSGRQAPSSAPMGGASTYAVTGGSVASSSTGSPAVQARPATIMPPAPPADPIPAEITTYGTAEQYTDHGVNPFTMVAEDHLSTFSIDVDTASYSIMRKKVEAGVLPPAEAVRVEEFVNYFDYGYRAPTDGSPFSVHMAAMPDPFRDGQHILRVGIQGDEVSRDERAPVHLTFLVDVSGSMSSADKLGLAKSSLHMMVDSLREDDTVALATYAGRVSKILAPTSAGNKRQIHDAIEALNAGGSTAMSSGIDLAYGMAWESFEKGHENRVIVMSDGDANVGKTSWDDMLSQVKGYADKGVTLSTIGFGMGNYKDTLMEQLSNKGDGNNYYIDDADQAQRVFVDDLGGTLVTIARDVKIQVDFNDESVLAYRLIGYENRDIADKDFRNDKVDAGEVGAGHNVTALYSVILKDGYARDLATVRLRWEQPGADVGHGGSAATERSYGFKDRALAERVDFASKDLRLAYASATFAEVLRDSPEAEELSMDALIAFAEAARRAGEKDDVELVELMKKAQKLGAGSSGGRFTSR